MYITKLNLVVIVEHLLFTDGRKQSISTKSYMYGKRHYLVNNLKLKNKVTIKRLKNFPTLELRQKSKTLVIWSSCFV